MVYPIDFAGEPSYKLVIRTDSPTVDKEKDFNFDVFFSGAGDVDHAKLFVLIPYYLAAIIRPSGDDQRLPSKMMPRAVVTYWDVTLGAASLPDGLRKVTGMKWTEQPVQNLFCITLPSIFFSKFVRTDEAPNPGFTCSGEMEGDYPPLTCRFKIARDAPPGDHEIVLNLVYRDAYGKLKWFSDKASLKIHIKKWYETEEIQVLSLAYIIVSLLVMLWTLWSLISSLCQ